MAGHSKWKQIKHYKAATDAKRGAQFTKLIREITMAAKLSGGDPAHNPRLRTAIDAAKARSMPKENIERAIKKGTGELEGVHYTEVTYEGYGPGGVAILISALSDNPTRTVAEIRHKLTKLGGNLGTPNSVSYLFDLKGQIYLDGSMYDEDKVLEAALEGGAEDFNADGEQLVVTTDPHQMHTVQAAIEAAGFKIIEAEVAFIPKSTVHVAGKNAESLVKLLDELEDLDDVQKVSANFDMDVEQMSGA
ncbi:MAG TPA: YebC/PmpR family DNA-binding transcriptional regulator [Gemmatimonadaceae bacterium]|nr:YebC/PmpR family DNA-binding transcriptional regulator [Gemmatimonadaceae bacterium]